MQKRIEKYFFLSVQQMVSLEETNYYIKQLFFLHTLKHLTMNVFFKKLTDNLNWKI